MMNRERQAPVFAAIIGAMASIAQAQGVPEVTQSQFATPPSDTRNYRYCEIIPVFRDKLNVLAEVYNTVDLNDNPAELWDALKPETMIEA